MNTSIARLLSQARRMWIVEQSARQLLLTLAWTANGVLACLALSGLFEVTKRSTVVVCAISAVVLFVILFRTTRRAPAGKKLALNLDDRAGTKDLFTSALEFEEQPQQFGWMSNLTCDLALEQASAVALRPQWTLKPIKQWFAAGTVALLLVATWSGAVLAKHLRRSDALAQAPVVEKVRPLTTRGEATDVKPFEADVKPPEEINKRAAAAEPPKDEPEPKEDDVVKISNAMADKLMNSDPDPQPVDLSGVTPIKWTDDQLSGKDNDQTTRDQGKIDPVKLDAQMMKDLENAKKEKDKSGGDSKDAVQIAVMGTSEEGKKAKDSGGDKKDGDTLAGAASKDPRGDHAAARLKINKDPLSIYAAGRIPSQSKGQDRPMGPLDFYKALQNTTSKLAARDNQASPAIALHAQDRVMPQETVAEHAVTVVDSYFEKLRKEDR